MEQLPVRFPIQNAAQDDPRIAKLPVWAQELIKDLVRQRDQATKVLHDFRDGQTPAAFFYEDDTWEGMDTGGRVTHKRFVQTNRITCAVAGMELELMADEDGARLYMNVADHRLGSNVALLPESGNTVRFALMPNGAGVR